MLKDFNIKPFLATIKNSQENTLVERVHQVILNIISTKDLDNKVFNHIDSWCKTLSYISWVIRTSYKHTILATPVQAVFGRDVLFDLASAVDFRVVTDVKQQQVDIDNFRVNDRQVTHDYAIGNQVYV